MSDPDFIRTARASYDAIAPDYAERFRDGLAVPLDRAVVTCFADLVKATGTAPVADIGCGPGDVTARLHDLGLSVFGVDVSPGMVALARRAHPELRFHVGSMTALDLPSDSVAGIAALYSIIHIPDDRLPLAFAEFHRVLVPGGHVLLAFQTGGEHLHLTERFGHAVSLDYYLRHPDTVTALLTGAGLLPHAQVLREPSGDETRQRAFLLATKPAHPPADQGS
ncbi:class I SAM-dependent DNA methyltransferase [Streptomyces sp. NPDC002845]